MRVCRLLRRKSDPGFTLIEILVSLLIVSFLGGAIYVTLAQGIKIWQAAVRESAHGQEEFFFEELKSELRNAYPGGKKALNGRPTSVEFYTWTREIREERKVLKVPARVRYYFDANNRRILKETVVYEKLLLDKANEPVMSKMVLEDVTGFRADYFMPPKSINATRWTAHWSGTCLPEAVKVTVDTVSGRKWSRIMPLPAATGCKEEVA